MAAASPGIAASSSDVFTFVPPVLVTTHTFKRFGSLHISRTSYESSSLSNTLYRTHSHLAVSNRYSRVFLVSPTSPPTLLVASTSAVIAAVSSAGDEVGEYEDDSKQASITATAFVPLPLLDANGVWHLSLSSDEQWLLAIAKEQGSLYHISQLARPEAGVSLSPMLTFDHPDVIVSLQWSPHHASLLYVLSSDGQLSVRQVSETGVAEVGLFYNVTSPITAFLLSAHTADDELIYLAHADGSLDVGILDIDVDRLSRHSYAVRDDDDEDEEEEDVSNEMQMHIQRRYKGRNPCPRDFSQQPAIHHISQLDSHTLILGYALSRSSDVLLSNFLTDDDVARVAVCSFNLNSGEEQYWGDVLDDELRLRADDKPYTARHRYSLLPLPPLSTALLWSTRAAETVLVGIDPADEHGRWVPYELPAEEDKAVVPFDADFNDTYALGMGFDVTNNVQVVCNESETAAMPLLMMLTSDGTLHLYHFICNHPSAALASQRVMLTSVEAMPDTVTFSDSPATPDTSIVSHDNTAKTSALILEISTPATTPLTASDLHVSSPTARSLSSTVGHAYLTHSVDTTAPVTPVSSSSIPLLPVTTTSSPAFTPILVLAPSSPSSSRQHDTSPVVSETPSSVSTTGVPPLASTAVDTRSASPDTVTFHYVQTVDLLSSSSSSSSSSTSHSLLDSFKDRYVETAAQSAEPSPSAVDVSTAATLPPLHNDFPLAASYPSTESVDAAPPDHAALPASAVVSSLAVTEAADLPSRNNAQSSVVSHTIPSLSPTSKLVVSDFVPDVSAHAADEALSEPAVETELLAAESSSNTAPSAVPHTASVLFTSSEVVASASTFVSSDEQSVLVDEPTWNNAAVISQGDVIAPATVRQLTAAPAAPTHSDVQTELTNTAPAKSLPVSELTAQFVSLTNEWMQRQEQLAASRQQLHALEQSTLALHSHHSVLHSLHSQIASLTEQLIEQQSRADSLDSRIDQQSAHLDDVSAAFESADCQRLAVQAAAETDARSHADVVRQLQAELAAAKAATATAISPSLQTDSAVAQLQAELATVRTELALSRQQLTSSVPLSQHRHELAIANSQLFTTQTEFTAAQSTVVALRKELSDAAAANKAAASMNGFPFESKEFRSALEAFSAHEHNLATLRQQLHTSHPLASNPLTTTTTTANQPATAAQISLQQADQVTRHLLLSSQLAIVGQDCLGSLDKVRREVEHLVRHEEGRSQRLRHAQKGLTKSGKPLDASSYSVSDQCSIS